MTEVSSSNVDHRVMVEQMAASNSKVAITSHRVSNSCVWVCFFVWFFSPPCGQSYRSHIIDLFIDLYAKICDFISGRPGERVSLKGPVHHNL